MYESIVERLADTKQSVDPYVTERDYCRFKSILSVDQIAVIGNEMSI